VKALQTFAPGEAAIVELPDPEPGPGEIVVAMKAVGLCGSDVHDWYVATKTASGPVVLGHETAGEVALVGKGVTAFAPGDRVFVHHHTSCGACRACLRGEDVMCPEWKPTRLYPGGLAERVRVDALTVARDTLKLPGSVGWDAGAMVEPVACGVKAVDRGQVRPGDVVLVLGLGSNGILLGLLARKAGAITLLGSDPDPARRAYARAFGFDRVVDPGAEDPAAVAREESGGAGADAVFVIPTGEAVVRDALLAAGGAAHVVFYSPIAPAKVWAFEPSVPYFRDLTLRFSYSSGPSETRRALTLLEEGLVDLPRFVTHRLPLARAPEGFALAAEGGEALKVLIEI
jgi:L-iditol 2-dehydrogenase